jgi:hypothetical protein
MLEKVLELLTALAIAAPATAAPGLQVASDHVSKAADQIAARASVHGDKVHRDKHADAVENARDEDVTQVDDAADLADDADAWSPPGLTTAAEATERNMENGPEQAQAGLQNALDHVQANAEQDHTDGAH